VFVEKKGGMGVARVGCIRRSAIAVYIFYIHTHKMSCARAALMGSRRRRKEKENGLRFRRKARKDGGQAVGICYAKFLRSASITNMWLE